MAVKAARAKLRKNNTNLVRRSYEDVMREAYVVCQAESYFARSVVWESSACRLRWDLWFLELRWHVISRGLFAPEM